MAGSTYTQDAAIVGAMALLTTLLRSQAQHFFERRMPEWQKLGKNIQSRLSVEIAAIPTRIMLIYFTLPIILRGFEPISSWRAEDTEACILASAILTGTYIIDLTVTRNDRGSTLHHLMGPALLLWIRTCFSTFTPSDALLCRLLMSFVFFGGTISGATTTALVFLFQFRNIWSQSQTWITAKNAYFYFTLLLPMLAFSTLVGVFYCTAYLHYWFNESVAYFGYWGYLPLSWVALECGLQWKWLWWFYNFEARYRSKFAEAAAESKSKDTLVANGAWWLPSWRFIALQVLITIWVLTVAALIWRHGDIQAVAGLVVSRSVLLAQSQREGFNTLLNRAALREL